MTTHNSSKRICTAGHIYYKSSDCPVCPVCESERQPEEDFLAVLSAPARRALENAGIKTPERLAEYSEKELLALHGLGPSSIPKLQKLLKKYGLTFRLH